MKSNEAATRKLISKLKMLKTRRKALAKAEKDGRSADAATIVMDVTKLETWFRENHPELDIATIKSMNTVLKEAENTLKILTAPVESTKKRKTTAISTENMMPAENGSGTPTTSKTRKRPAAVRRHPAMQKKA
ncbi:MAG: hypothetical protein ACK5MU_02440 [Candidatus Saccharimonadales bacterium]